MNYDVGPDYKPCQGMGRLSHRSELTQLNSGIKVQITEIYTGSLHQLFTVVLQMCLIAMRAKGVCLEPDLIFLRANLCRTSVSSERPMLFVPMRRLEMSDEVHVIGEARVIA